MLQVAISGPVIERAAGGVAFAGSHPDYSLASHVPRRARKWELYRSNADRIRAFDRWLWHYNRTRPHTALGGLAPMAFLINNVRGNCS
ncbi:MAG: integrase core domain-containing protein [Isosphaeraceae bacterium]